MRCVCARASIAGKLTMEWLNDANAIFEYKGKYHIMVCLFRVLYYSSLSHTHRLAAAIGPTPSQTILCGGTTSKMPLILAVPTLPFLYVISPPQPLCWPKIARCGSSHLVFMLIRAILMNLHSFWQRFDGDGAVLVGYGVLLVLQWRMILGTTPFAAHSCPHSSRG